MNGSDVKTLATLDSHSSVDLEQVEEELQALWDELRTDPRLKEKARAAGLDDGSLSVQEKSPYHASREESQFGVATTILISVTGALAKDALAGLWKEFVWPRLKRRFGHDLEPRENGSKD